MDITSISDNQAEATIIATLIEHPDFILHTDYLKPSYFYNEENGCIYWAIQELYKNGVETIDALNLSTAINSNPKVKKKLEEFNLTNLQEFVQTSGYACRHSLEEYKLSVDRVVSLSFKREMNKIAKEIQSVCYDNEKDLSDLNTIVNDKINKLTIKYVLSSEIETLGTFTDQLWSEIVSRRTTNGIYGIPSKFEVFNKYFTYEPGELVLVKARMKRGKSAFFLNEAIDKLKNGVAVLYMDTEMQDRLFYTRLLANLTGVEVNRIKNGNYDYKEDMQLAKARDWLEKQPLYHRYIPNATDDEIYTVHKVLKYKVGLEFSIFDYIKSNVTSTSDNYNILGAKCDFLKNRIAGELNIAMLAGAQLNRQNQVADSDKLERYVSTSVYWREKTSDELRCDGIDCGNYAASVDLNRNGEMMEEEDYLDFNFDGGRMRITQAKQHEKAQKPFEA